MIDIHTHILYGVDDGAGDLMLALDMLGEEWKQGVSSVVLTPHYGPKFESLPVGELKKKYERLCDRAREFYPDLKLYLGSEIYYYDGMLHDLQAGKIPTINDTQYILVEFSFEERDSEIMHAIEELVYAGYIPIIAHVERYRSLLEQYDTIESLMDAGAYIQVNVKSFLGGMFHRKTSFVKKLVKMNLVDFIGSDCHDLVDRVPNLEAGRKVIEKLTDFSRFMENAERVLKGDYI
nr:CpsB/CapC family capsule biosynthesis tyrosine phosphatase [uncultured Anaerostipes sp.]